MHEMEANRAGPVIEHSWVDPHGHVTRSHQLPSIAAPPPEIHRYLAERFDIRRRLLLAA